MKGCSYKLDILDRTRHQQCVDEFMRLAKQDVPDEPTIPSAEIRVLRARLILEEALEAAEALGCVVEVGGFNIADEKERKEMLTIEEDEDLTPDLEHIAKECADISVVTTGTLTACGIADDSVLREVDSNNLDKFGPGHSYREDGKLIKPPGHKPARIAEVLAEQTTVAQAKKAF